MIKRTPTIGKVNVGTDKCCVSTRLGSQVQLLYFILDRRHKGDATLMGGDAPDGGKKDPDKAHVMTHPSLAASVVIAVCFASHGLTFFQGQNRAVVCIVYLVCWIGSDNCVSDEIRLSKGTRSRDWHGLRAMQVCGHVCHGVNGYRRLRLPQQPHDF